MRTILAFLFIMAGGMCISGSVQFLQIVGHEGFIGAIRWFMKLTGEEWLACIVVNVMLSPLSGGFFFMPIFCVASESVLATWEKILLLRTKTKKEQP